MDDAIRGKRTVEALTKLGKKIGVPFGTIYYWHKKNTVRIGGSTPLTSSRSGGLPDGHSPSIRVQKGQVACLHGLILAGVPYLMACKVAGVHHERMAPYVSRDWRRGRHPIPLKRLPAFQRKAYELFRHTMPRDQAYLIATKTVRRRPYYRYSP